MDYIHSLVVDELTPVIDDGFTSGPTTDVMKRIEELVARTADKMYEAGWAFEIAFEDLRR